MGSTTSPSRYNNRLLPSGAAAILSVKLLQLLFLATIISAQSTGSWPGWNDDDDSSTNYPDWNNGGGGGGGGNGDGGNNNNPAPDFGNGELVNSFLGFDVERASYIRSVHGVVAAVAFVGLFPIGSILLRVIPGRAAWIMHALCQMLAYCLYIAGAGLGIWLVATVELPNGQDLLSLTPYNAHPIIGLVLLALLFVQPVLGFVHHARFKRTGRRGVWSHLHLFVGRAGITLGLINGGLGLWMAGATRNPIIAYSVVAGFVWLVWLGVAVFHEMRRGRKAAHAQHNTHHHQHRGGSNLEAAGAGAAAAAGRRSKRNSRNYRSSAGSSSSPPAMATTGLRGGGREYTPSRWSEDTHQAHDDGDDAAGDPGAVSPMSKTFLRSSGGTNATSNGRPETATTTSSWGNHAHEFQDLRAPPPKPPSWHEAPPHLPPLDTRGATRVSGVPGVRY